VVAAYRNSYFGQGTTSDSALIASVRAGNVIGGGDWSTDRLIPDLVRAFERDNRPVIRSPAAVRPWQHVLEALSGYIVVAQRLLVGEAHIADAWNFGPREEDAQTVAWIVRRMAKSWGIAGDYENWTGSIPHEANVLRLDTSKARAVLGWRPKLTIADAIDLTVEWHKLVTSGANARDVTNRQIRQYFASHDMAPAKAA
jgi:CDP-glucose 4,6-dehydratase